MLQKHINVGTTYKALGFKRKTKNQLKIYKNEMMIMREKHMRKKKIGNIRKGSNFVKK